MKKILSFASFLLLLIFLVPSVVSASSMFKSIDVNKLDFNSISENKVDELKETIESLNSNTFSSSAALNNIDKNAVANGDVSSIDVNKIDINEVAEVYQELSKVISNDDIADFIDDNKETLSKSGVDESLLQTSSTMLRVFDANAVIDVMKNDLDLEEILKSYQNRCFYRIDFEVYYE